MQANHAKGWPSFFDDILAAQEQQPCLFLGATTPVEAPSCLHFHKQLEMGLCLSGRGVFYIHGEVYPYGAGDISLIYPGESHIAQSARSAPSDWLFLTVDTERLFSGVRDEARLRALSFRPLGTGHVLSGEENRTVVAFLRRTISLYEDKSRTHDEKREQYAALLACLLYESVAWEHRPVAATVPLYTERLREIYPAVQYILNRYTEDVQTTQLCEACSLSPVHLRRLFAALLGLSPIAFLHKTRISHACSALADPSLSMLAVAEQCGYSSLSSFNRQFQKWMHCSPSEYRTAHQREK